MGWRGAEADTTHRLATRRLMRAPLGGRRLLVVGAALAFGAAVPALARAQDIACDRPGAKEVRTLNFEGNRTFKDDDLSALVLTTPSSFTHRYFRWFFNAGTARCLPDVGLRGDVENLKQFYKNYGFYATVVDTVVKQRPPDQVDVTFRITEGPPLLLDSLTITGLDSVPDSAAIVRDLPIAKGQRVGLVPMYQAVDTIRARLRNDAYPNAEVLPAFSGNPASQRASVTLDAVTGTRARFGTIAVTRAGPEPPRPAQIDSASVLRLLGFRSGDWYSDEAIADARRNLYNLGAYRHVGIEPDTTRSASDTLVGILVDLREDYMRQIVQEEGWATLDCFRVDAQYSDKDFLDRALRLDLTGRVSKLGFGAPTHWGPLCRRGDLSQDSLASSKLNYYAGATVRQPTLFGGNWIPAYSAYTERRGQYKSFLRTTFLGLDVSATRNISTTTPFRLGYTLEFGQTFAEPAFLCGLFNRCEPATQADVQARLRLAVASASLQRVRTDNPVEPRNGYVVSGEVRGSAPAIGSDSLLTFFKVIGDGSIYRPLAKRVTFAARVRGGLVTASRLPPPQERLYAGGATSVRGFQQNELGPVVYLVDTSAFQVMELGKSATPGAADTVALVATDTAGSLRTIPTGGNRLVVVNTELRIRDPFIPDLLEWVPFLDAGEVLTSEVGKSGFNLDRLTVTPGLGARYFSPIGPIQLNAGYNPSKTRAGQAYYAPFRSNGQAPLVCVTAPGTPVVPSLRSNGAIIRSLGDCPVSFVPRRSSGFFSRFTFTLSIGTDF